MLNKLGYSQNDRLLIINADDFGMSHSTNEAVMELLKEGYISSATVMMPCPWAKEAVEFCRDNPEVNVGVHLTFTSEWNKYKWGPVNQNGRVDSLVDEYGYLHKSTEQVRKKAKREQVREEIRAQIEKALKLGLDPTHLDNHMGSLYGLGEGECFLDIIFDFCEEYRLPFRLPTVFEGKIEKQVPKELVERIKPYVEMAQSRGIALIDHLIGFSTGDKRDYESCRNEMIRTLRNLKPGITELYIHPAKDSEELRAITNNWLRRVNEYKVFKDSEVRNVIEEEGIKIISWKELRDIQRAK